MCNATINDTILLVLCKPGHQFDYLLVSEGHVSTAAKREVFVILKFINSCRLPCHRIKVHDPVSFVGGTQHSFAINGQFIAAPTWVLTGNELRGFVQSTRISHS